MPQFPHAIAAIVLLGLASTSCQQTIPSSSFDARAEQVRHLTFKDVKLNRAPDRSLLRPPTETYILGPGDVMDIEIAEVKGTLARTFVMPDGMVYYNLAGGVHAEGLTTAEFSKKLQQALKRDYTNPTVNVALAEVHSRRYWVLGRVFKPGLYPLQQPTTLLEAISQAGGLFTSRFSGTTEELADLSNSVVIRNGEVLPIDFTKLIRSGDTSYNIYLQHNDYIYLPSAATSTVLVLGSVAAPQAVGYNNSLSLIDCIAQCKGPAKEAYLKEVVIVRGTLNKPAASVVNLEAILTGRETNVLLEAGDIVWIPKRPLGLLETTVQVIFRDAARTIASGEGSRVVGGSQDPVISIPLSSPSSP